MDTVRDSVTQTIMTHSLAKRDGSVLRLALDKMAGKWGIRYESGKYYSLNVVEYEDAVLALYAKYPTVTQTWGGR